MARSVDEILRPLGANLVTASGMEAAAGRPCGNLAILHVGQTELSRAEGYPWTWIMQPVGPIKINVAILKAVKAAIVAGNKE